jgi:hypothetical protein
MCDTVYVTTLCVCGTVRHRVVPGRDLGPVPSAMPATYGPVWRVVRLQGPLWSSGFVTKIMCPLLRQYWRYMRPRAISLSTQVCAVGGVGALSAVCMEPVAYGVGVVGLGCWYSQHCVCRWVLGGVCAGMLG